LSFVFFFFLAFPPSEESQFGKLSPSRVTCEMDFLMERGLARDLNSIGDSRDDESGRCAVFLYLCIISVLIRPEHERAARSNYCVTRRHVDRIIPVSRLITRAAPLTLRQSVKFVPPLRVIAPMRAKDVLNLQRGLQGERRSVWSAKTDFAFRSNCCALRSINTPFRVSSEGKSPRLRLKLSAAALRGRNGALERSRGHHP